jgi:hypothetical protein
MIMTLLDWIEGCSDSRTPGENSRPTPLKHLLGVDALEVEMTTEVCIVGEDVSNMLVSEGVLRDRVLVVAHQEHASQVTDQVLFGVRVITE